jgi:hypothetical protein
MCQTNCPETTAKVKSQTESLTCYKVYWCRRYLSRYGVPQFAKKSWYADCDHRVHQEPSYILGMHVFLDEESLRNWVQYTGYGYEAKPGIWQQKSTSTSTWMMVVRVTVKPEDVKDVGFWDSFPAIGTLVTRKFRIFDEDWVGLSGSPKTVER